MIIMKYKFVANYMIFAIKVVNIIYQNYQWAKKLKLK